MNATFGAPRQAPGKRISFVLAVLVHVLLVVLLVYGIRWQNQPAESVSVELVRAVPPAPTSATPEPRPEHPTTEAQPEPKPELKPEPKPVPKPPVRPEIAQKEKPKPEPKEKPKPEPKEKPKPEPQPQPAVDPFKEQLERELREAERRKAAQAAAEAAAEELARLKAQQAEAAKERALADYIAHIKAKVRGNIILPGDLKGNPEAIFEVTQLPTGEVLSVKLKKSSGHPAWDAATERAILKSSPLPKPARSELFSRTLELKFRPLEE